MLIVQPAVVAPPVTFNVESIVTLPVVAGTPPTVSITPLASTLPPGTICATPDDVIVCAVSFTASITSTTADALLLAALLSLRALVWPATGNVPVAGAVKLMSQVMVSPCPLLPGNKSMLAGNASGTEFTSRHCVIVTPGVLVAQVASYAIERTVAVAGNGGLPTGLRLTF